MNIQAYNKAIAAVFVPVILAGLDWVGITPDMSVSDAVEFAVLTAITAAAVWLVPNRP